jgi:hypothetical protein
MKVLLPHYFVYYLRTYKLSFVSVFYPIVFDMFDGKTRPLHVVMGIMAHLSLSILAIALSAAFTRDLVKNKENTWWGVGL